MNSPSQLKFPIILLLIAMLLLAACSLDENLANHSENIKTHKVSGSVVKGPVSNSSIKLYALNEKGEKTGSAIQQATTDANGNWNLTTTISSQALLIEASGGFFVDESDPEPDISKKRKITLNASEVLYGILPGNSSNAVVTFTTHALYLQLKNYVSTAGTFQEEFIRTQNRVNNHLGFDPFTTTPANPTAPAAGSSKAQINYALIAGGQANILNNIAVTSGRGMMDYSTISSMANDFDDCTLDGNNALGLVQISTPNGNKAISVSSSLNKQIERFRNNNYSHYTAAALPSIDETALCNRAIISNITQAHFIHSENNGLAARYEQTMFSGSTTDIKLGAYIDKSSGVQDSSVIYLFHKFNPTTNKFEEQLILRSHATTAGSYQASSTANVTFHSGNQTFVGTSGNIIVDHFGDINGVASGRYRISLCRENSDCKLATNQLELAGFFAINREADFLNTSQGTKLTPQSLINIDPANSSSTNNLHVSAAASSFYHLSVPVSSTLNLELNNTTDDITLQVFSDSDHNNLLCTLESTPPGSSNCTVNTTSNNLYVTAVLVGQSRQASFDLNANVFPFSLQTNNTTLKTYTDSEVTAYIDQRYTNNKHVQIRLNTGMNEALILSANSSTAGTYNLGANAEAYYQNMGIEYVNDNNHANGSIIIASFSTVGQAVSGSYSLTLCQSGLDCSISTNQINLSGTFFTTRDADVNFASQGSITTAAPLGFIPYDSSQAVALSQFDETRHHLQAGTSSYYQINADSSSQYHVHLLNMSDDVNLAVYSDSGFSLLLCDSLQIGSSDEQCSLTTNAETNLYIKVDYNGLGTGAWFDLSTNRDTMSLDLEYSGEQTYTETNFTNTTTDVAISALYNKTALPTAQTEIKLQHSYLPPSGPFDKELALSFNTNIAGSYSFNVDADGYYRNGPNTYTVDATYSTGTVNVTNYGAAGEHIEGNYDINLCLEFSDCSQALNRIHLSGQFLIFREADEGFQAEGNIATPLNVGASPYNSATYFTGEKHQVDSMPTGAGSSYYSVMVTPGSQYIITLGDLSDDVSLSVYSDSAYSSLLCTINNPGTVDEQCGVNNPNSILYIQVDYNGVGEGALFHLNVQRDHYTQSTDGGTAFTSYYENPTLSFDDVNVSATWDHTASPTMQTVIQLADYWSGSYHDRDLELRFDANTPGTYTLGVDGYAHFTQWGSTNYLDDGVNSSGTINIDQYGAEGNVIRGSYNLLLCMEAMDCTQAMNQLTLEGEFTLVRDADVLFYPEGTSGSPVNFPGAPYDSVMDNAGNPHQVDALASSYYSVFVNTNSQYLVHASALTDDITLSLYSDAAYSVLLCTINNAGTVDEVCGADMGMNSTLYIQVDYNGVGEGALFHLNVQRDHYTQSTDGGTSFTPYYENPTLSFDDVNVSATWDHTASPTMQTVIQLADYWSGSYHDRDLELRFDANTPGTYTLGVDGYAHFTQWGSTNYLDDGVNSSGTINIDQYGAEGNVIRGSYNLLLCMEAMDCTQAMNQLTLEGEFTLVRDADVLFYPEGTSGSPVNFPGAPYDSVMDNAGNPHQVDALASSYYSVFVNTNSQYLVHASALTDDITLSLYSDAAYSVLLCTINNAGTVDEVCGADMGMNSTLYIQVDYNGVGEGALFHLNVQRDHYTQSTDGGTAFTSYYENPTLSFDDVNVSATWDHTASPTMQTVIQLADYWSGAYHDRDLELRFDTNTSGTYTLGVDGYAHFTQWGSTNYLEDGVNSSGTINIDQYGAEGNVIRGSYHLLLCMESMDCTQVMNQLTLEGEFTLVRDADVLFYPEGSSGSPVNFPGAPYDSVMDNAGNPHQVDALASSYYSVFVNTNSQYLVHAAALTDDITLSLYADAAYSVLLCTINNTGTVDEICGADTGMNSTLYIQVDYNGVGEGALFHLNVQRDHYTQSTDGGTSFTPYYENPTLSFDDVNVSATWDHTASPTMQTVIQLADYWSGAYHDRELELRFDTNTSGTYTLGVDGYAHFTQWGSTNYVDDGVNSSGTINIDQYGAEGNVIRGSYHLLLCMESMDCTQAMNQLTLEGEFKLVRDPDIGFVPEGTLGTPYDLMSAPYHSQADNLTNPHMVDSTFTGGTGISYYSVNVNTFTPYVVSLNELTDDVTLTVYSDSLYASQLCTSANAGSIYEGCSLNSSSFNILYIKVEYSGGSEGAMYHIKVGSDLYTMSTDNGDTYTKNEEYISGSFDEVNLIGEYDPTATPGLRTKIKLAYSWNGSQHDRYLLLDLEGNTAGTYALGTNASAFYYDYGTNYIENLGNTSGTINIGYYGAVGDLILGNYDISLCQQNMDCSNPANRVQLQGTFDLTRDADKTLGNEGSSGTPINVGAQPYNSRNSNIGDKHIVVGTSYYQVDVSNNTNYTILLSELSDDVTLTVYSDAGFTSELCNSVNAGSTDESCAINSSTFFTFYIKVDYAGGGSGAAYHLKIGRDFYNLSTDNGVSYNFYEENITGAFDEVLVNGIWDPTNAPDPLRTRIQLSRDWNGSEHNENLIISFDSNTPGTYTLGSNASAHYKSMGTSYIEDSVYTSGTIIIDQLGSIGGSIEGSFNITLCALGTDCSSGTNLINLQGDFDVTRDTDKAYVDEGTNVTPVYLNWAPYDSIAQNLGDKHTASSGSSFYHIDVNTNTEYTFLISDLSEDTNLTIYSDSGFSSALCSSSNVGSADEICTIDSNIYSSLYIKIDYAGVGTGASYHIKVSRDSYMIDIDNGGDMFYEEYITGSWDEVLVSAAWDLTRAPDPSVTKIQLARDWNGSEHNFGLTFILDGNTTGTYTLGTDATANYKDGGILYLEDGVNTSGTITIDQYGAIGTAFTGSFNVTLCQESMDCTLAMNRRHYQGTFNMVRDPDKDFVDEGDNLTPIYLNWAPYDSVMQNFGDKHTASSGSSYYHIDVNMNTPYTFLLNSVSDDVTLSVYSDSNFLSLLCNSTTAGLVDESCTVDSAGYNALYIKVDYAGGGTGASYHLNINLDSYTINIDNGGDTIYEEYLNNGWGEVSISAMWDLTRAPSPLVTKIQLARDWTGSEHDKALSFSLDGNTTGTYTLGTDATANYKDGGILYLEDGINTSGTITIEQYGAVGTSFTGSFNVTLCQESMDCTIAMNRRHYQGTFNMVRDPDKDFVDEGDSITPIYLNWAPYDSVAQNFGDKHTASSGSSYYHIDVNMNTPYTFLLNSVSDDVTLSVYSDSNFLSQLCNSTTAGLVDESCTVDSAGYNALYIKVDYAGVGTGASYHLNINLDSYSINIDNGGDTIYEEYLNNGWGEVSISATWDLTRAPSPLVTKIQLARDWTGSEHDKALTFSLNGNTTGTYTLGTDATANYKESGILYLEDGVNTSGTITIDQYDAVGAAFTGSYNVTLCQESTDCTIAMNRRNYQGTFDMIRDPDNDFVDEGDNITPIYLNWAPYDSVMQNFGDKHTASSGSSYYHIDVNTNSNYTFLLSELSDDVDLTIYSDPSFLSTLCSSSNTASADEVCTVDSNMYNSLYIKVDYMGVGTGASYHINISRDSYVINIDNGGDNFYEEYLTASWDEVLVSAAWDLTAAPLGSKITLARDWNGMIHNQSLVLTFQASAPGTYTLNTDATAKYYDVGTNYIEDYVNSSGTITISEYGTIGNKVIGTYNVTLCLEFSDCSMAMNQMNLQGSFEMVRDIDQDFYAEGDIITPYYISGVPYDSTIDNNGNQHIADLNSSYYEVPVNTFTSYTFFLVNLNDNVELNVYTDSGFSVPFCSSSNTGTTDETCNSSTASDFNLYIRVDYLGGGNGTTYDLMITTP